MRRVLILITIFLLSLLSFAQSHDSKAAAAGSSSDSALTEAVTRMARVGRCGGATFSPDSKTLAFVCDMSGVPQVWTVGVDGGWPNLVTTLNDPVASVEWSPTSDVLAIQVAPGGGMNTQIYTVKPDGTGLKRYTPGGKDNNWLSRWTHDGRAIAMSSNVRSGANMDSYLLDVPGGEMKLVAENPGVGTIEDVSHDGHFALLSRLRNRGSNDVYLVDLNSKKETLLTPHEGPGQFAGLFGRDNHTVYLATNKDRDLVAFGKVIIGANGEAGPIKVIAGRDDAELESFRINDQGTTAALLWNNAGHNELAFVDLATEKTTPGPQLPAELAGGLEFSRDGKLLAMTVSGSAAPADVWVMDVATKHMHQVTHSPHAGVKLDELVRPMLVRFNSFDGLPLSGWLYLPKNYSAPGPVVLSFHGGPEGEEVPSFRSDYQALLSQGIAVLAPNVRGSSGFGKKFVNLDNGPLRVNGVKDIKSCVDYLVQNKIGDPKRLGIMGGSYGGYMVMAGLTEFPDTFAAGADLFGVVNFETFFQHTEPWMAAISTVEYGDPKTQADMLRSLSPIHKVDRVKAATIVLHGANDTNVPVVEAEQVVNNLKQRGVPVQYVLFPDEGHGWRKVPNRIRSTVEITKWFSQYLNPSNERAAAK
jgi:dipeptidyl aminopeptidase/acylaminoacyl peptidase